MGQVTILNGMNVPINSCISAVLNLSWCNKLSPKTYYQHNAGVGIVTLNVNYWYGEETEFSANPGEAITMVAGAGIAVAGLVVGIVAAPFTAGGSLAVAIAASTIFVAGAGVVVTAVSMAVKDFVNTPCKWTKIQALDDRKFIAEGSVTLSQSTGSDGLTTVIYTAIPTITLRELQEPEFQTLISTGGYTEHGAQPLAGEYVTVSELGTLNLTNVKVTISPALGGNCCWEIENDNTAEASLLQIWDRDVPQVYWMLVPTNSTDNTIDTFYLYNPVLSRYATSGQLVNDPNAVTASSNQSAFQQFRIMRSEDSDQFSAQPYFAFIPVQTQNCAVICQGGNLGHSTKLRLGPTTTINPMWALWKVTPVNA
jgi:hypothetical protein